MHRLDAAQGALPFTPPQGNGALNGGTVPEGPLRPTTRLAAPPPMASFSPAHAVGAGAGARPGLSAFNLGAAESSFSFLRDDPEASRSGLIGMSPLVFRQGALGVPAPSTGIDDAGTAGIASAAGAGTGISLGNPGPSRPARSSGSVLGFSEPMNANVLPPKMLALGAAAGSSGTGQGMNGSFLRQANPAAHSHAGEDSILPLGDTMLQRMRIWRTDAMHHHLYDSAIFWGDKILSLEETELAWNDAYWLAQAYFMTHQYARAEHLLTKPLRSAYTRRLAEEQQNSAGLAPLGPEATETHHIPTAHPRSHQPERAQIPRALDVLGTAISRARDTSVLPREILDQLPSEGYHRDSGASAYPLPGATDAYTASQSKRALHTIFSPAGPNKGMTKATSSASMAGKRKDRTFTVSGTGTGSSIGEHDGENGSIESGNSGSAGGPMEEDHTNELGPPPLKKADAKLAQDNLRAEAEAWQEEDAQNLMDVADRALSAFDGPVLANNSLACRCLAAQCQVRLGKYFEALETLGGDTAPWNLKALQSAKEPAVDGGIKLGSTAHFLRGQIYLRIDDLIKAQECFESALSIDVKNYEAFCALVNGNLLTVPAQWELIKALEYTAQTGPYPEDGEFIRLLYTSRLPKHEQSQLTEASAARRVLMTQYKVQDNADVLWTLAEELFAKMRYADAFTITSRIMELSKDHDGALPIHITCMFYMPKMRPALFMLAHRLVEDDPESPAAWFAVGAWYASAGRWAEARRYFSKATLLDPRFAPSWIAFGHSFAMEGESDQAITAYATAARKFQFSHLPKLFIGMEHTNQSNYKLAEVFLRGALTVAPKDPFVLNELGVLEYLLGRIDKAIDLFERALAASAEVQEPATAWTAAHMNLGSALRRAGRHEEARSRFLRVIELEPINIQAHVGVAMCEHKQGKLSAAIAWYHDALALNPRDTFCTALLDMALEESLRTPKLPQGEAQ
ncbi:hypothetical protein V8E36_002550 [Tilletia maclaganii]